MSDFTKESMLHEPKMQGTMAGLDRLWNKLQNVPSLPHYNLDGMQPVEKRVVVNNQARYIVKG